MLRLCRITISWIIGIYFVVGTIQGAEVVYIQHAPSYMQFSSDIEQPYLKASQIPDIIAAACGFTTSKDLRWEGLKSGNPLKRPKLVVVAELDGFENVNLALNYVQFPLSVDVQPDWPYRVSADRIYKRFSNQNLTLIEITNDDLLYSVKSQYPRLLDHVADNEFQLEKDLFSDKSFFYGKKLQALNISSTTDIKFLSDMQLFKEVTDSLRINQKELLKGSAVDLVWLHSTMMQQLKNVYDVNSPQINEAVRLIREVLVKMEASFSKIYGDNFLMMVLTVDYMSKSHSARVARSLLSDSSYVEPSSINLAETYSEDYPAIFNIIFFISLIIFLSLFAIALGMWHIDPGRDSIIYRMTSQRIKKDQ